MMPVKQEIRIKSILKTTLEVEDRIECKENLLEKTMEKYNHKILMQLRQIRKRTL